MLKKIGETLEDYVTEVYNSLKEDAEALDLKTSLPEQEVFPKLFMPTISEIIMRPSLHGQYMEQPDNILWLIYTDD